MYKTTGAQAEEMGIKHQWHECTVRELRETYNLKPLPAELIWSTVFTFLPVISCPLSTTDLRIDLFSSAIITH